MGEYSSALIQRLQDSTYNKADTIRCISWLTINAVLHRTNWPDVYTTNKAFVVNDSAAVVFCNGDTLTDAQILLLHLLHRGTTHVVHSREDDKCTWLTRNKELNLLKIKPAHALPRTTIADQSFALMVAWGVGAIQQHFFLSNNPMPPTFVYTNNANACVTLQQMFPLLSVLLPTPVLIQTWS
jgi:hypothetical protein